MLVEDMKIILKLFNNTHISNLKEENQRIYNRKLISRPADSTTYLKSDITISKNLRPHKLLLQQWRS